LHDKELYPNHGQTDAKGPHADEENFQKTREASPTKEATKWVRMGLGRSPQVDRPMPFLGPFVAPFDLDDLRAIYGPPANASIHSSFATEEQIREGHHLERRGSG
jgi:hypothetical protein